MKRILFVRRKERSEIDGIIVSTNKVLSRIDTVTGEPIKYPNKECWCYYEKMSEQHASNPRTIIN